MSALGIEAEEITEALERIGRTPDGWLLYLFLQNKLFAVPSEGMTVDALRENYAYRMLAGDLMQRMSKGILENNAGHDPSRRPVVFLSSKSSDTGGGYTSIRKYLRSDPEQLALERALTGAPGSNGAGSGA